MKNNSWTDFFLKISWLIGFFLLVFGSISINNQAKAFSSSTFNFAPYFWASAITSIVIGAYIALLFLKQWKLQFTPGLFVCVTIPCLILTLYFPILTIAPTYFENFQLLATPQLLGLTPETIFGVVAGLTLVLSVFKWRD